MVTVKLWYWDTCSILILVSIQWLKIIQNDYTIFFWKKVLKNLIIYPKNVNQITWNSLKIQNTLSQKKEAATRLSEFLIPTGIFPVSDAGFLDCLGLSLFMTYFSSCLEIQYKMFMKKKSNFYFASNIVIWRCTAFMMKTNFPEASWKASSCERTLPWNQTCSSDGQVITCQCA